MTATPLTPIVEEWSLIICTYTSTGSRGGVHSTAVEVPGFASQALVTAALDAVMQAHAKVFDNDYYDANLRVVLSYARKR